MASVAGCVNQGGGGRPPIVGPPKVVVNHGPDNLTEVFVRASVGDINFTRITLRLDNATAGQDGFFEVRHAFALDVKVDRTRFHANVTVVDGRGDDAATYAYAAVVRINATDGSATLQPYGNDGDLRDREEADLPVSRLLAKREGA